jgi:hypothetical protein
VACLKLILLIVTLGFAPGSSQRKSATRFVNGLSGPRGRLPFASTTAERGRAPPFPPRALSRSRLIRSGLTGECPRICLVASGRSLQPFCRVYEKDACGRCGARVVRTRMGENARMTIYCPCCQPERPVDSVRVRLKELRPSTSRNAFSLNPKPKP